VLKFTYPVFVTQAIAFRLPDRPDAEVLAM